MAEWITKNPLAGSVVLLAFGYLLGIVLRVMKTEPADLLSAWFLRRIQRNTRVMKRPLGVWLLRSASLLQLLADFRAWVTGVDPGIEYRKWAYRRFPYIEWVEEVARTKLPQCAQDFFDAAWKLPAPRDSNNVDFFNFLKLRINAIDEKSAREVWSAESMTRYTASSLYALFFSWVLACGRLVMVAAGR